MADLPCGSPDPDVGGPERIGQAGHRAAEGVLQRGLAVRQLADLIPNITEVKAQHYPNAAFVEFQGVIDEIHKSAIENKVDDLVIVSTLGGVKEYTIFSIE